MIIAIDFDGTIVKNAYPNIGEILPRAKEVINKLYNEGHIIIINSNRVSKTQGEAEDFLKIKGIKFHYFNTNYPGEIIKWGIDSRKISADVYIDDKSIFTDEINWDEIEYLLKIKEEQYMIKNCIIQSKNNE